MRTKYGFEFLKGCTTNQDYLERLFGLFRSMGGSSSTPTALQLLFILGRYIGGLLCDEDEDDFNLLSFRSEIEKLLEMPPMPDKEIEEIDQKLAEYDRPDLYNESESRYFNGIAATIVEKVQFSHPDLLDKSTKASHVFKAKFANSLSQGCYLVIAYNLSKIVHLNFCAKTYIRCTF